MLPLRELQEQFLSVLFGRRPDAEATWVREDGPAAGCAARLGIYRNNLREGFIKALRLEFPVIERLVGSDYFRQLGQEFLTEHPSRAGDLHAIGGAFPDYLHARFADTEYAYLPDVAALEWAYEEAAIAPDAPPLDLESLARVAPESYGRLRFKLHPACRLVCSAYPILKIWQVNQADAAGDESVDLSAGAAYVATRRVGDGVELRSVAPADYLLLEALASGATLDAACSAATQVDPDFDLGRALRQLFVLRLISDSRTENLCLNTGILP